MGAQEYVYTPATKAMYYIICNSFQGDQYQAVAVLLFMFLHGYYWNDLLNSMTFIRFLNISELLGISQVVNHILIINTENTMSSKDMLHVIVQNIKAI